jgi:hypothetical protein
LKKGGSWRGFYWLVCLAIKKGSDATVPQAVRPLVCITPLVLEVDEKNYHLIILIGILEHNLNGNKKRRAITNRRQPTQLSALQLLSHGGNYHSHGGMLKTNISSVDTQGAHVSSRQLKPVRK